MFLFILNLLTGFHSLFSFSEDLGSLIPDIADKIDVYLNDPLFYTVTPNLIQDILLISHKLNKNQLNQMVDGFCKENTFKCRNFLKMIRSNPDLEYVQNFIEKRKDISDKLNIKKLQYSVFPNLITNVQLATKGKATPFKHEVDTQYQLNKDLLYAVENANINEIDNLLKKGANINAILNESSAVMLAASIGNTQITDFLIKKGADVNNIGPNRERTALHCACFNGDLPMVKLLIKNGAKLDAIATPAKLTPLMIAAGNGHSTVVNELIKAGSNVSAISTEGQTALLYAVKGGKDDAASLLINTGKALDFKEDYGFAAIHHLACDGKESLISLMLKKGAQVDLKDANGSTPLYHAIHSAQLPVVETLIKYGANVFEPGGSQKIAPIINACITGSWQIVKTLIGRGCDPNRIYNDFTPLCAAASKCRSEVVRNLILQGVNLNALSRGNTALTYAIDAECAECVQLLIDAGCDIGTIDVIGRTPIIAAIQHNMTDAVHELIELNSDLDIYDMNGMSPLMYAISLGQTKMALELIKHGAHFPPGNSDYMEELISQMKSLGLDVDDVL